MELLTQGTYISRVGYCSDCEKQKRPHTGQKFKVIGSRDVHIYTVEFIPRFYGFTPHIYVIHRVIGDNVVYDYICGMYGCGIIREYNKNERCYEYTENPGKWKRVLCTLAEWNALVKYNHDSQYFL